MDISHPVPFGHFIQDLESYALQPTTFWPYVNSCYFDTQDTTSHSKSNTVHRKKRRVEQALCEPRKKPHLEMQDNRSQRNTNSRRQSVVSSTSSTSGTSRRAAATPEATVSAIEDDLHHLQDEWATIDIVLNSLRTAFPVEPAETASEERLDERDRELSIAYDDLMAQVRHLDRSLRRLDAELNILRQQASLLAPPSATEDDRRTPSPPKDTKTTQ